MGTFLWLMLLFPGLCAAASSVARQFHVVKEEKTWEDARQHCREKFTDLATIDDMTEMKKLHTIIQKEGGENSWIGLNYGSSPKWQWSLADRDFYGENETEFRNWAPGQPGRPPRYYAAIGPEGQWYKLVGATKYPFICYDGTNLIHPHVLIEDGKSWADAQRYCSEHYTDLASVRNQTENDLMEAVKPQGMGYAWIGLFRTLWEWSDGSSSSFRYWDHGQPSSQGEKCVEVLSSGWWNDNRCGLSKNFICYQDLPAATVELVSPPGPHYSGDVITLKCSVTQFDDWPQYIWLKDNSTVGETSQTISITLPLEAGQYQCYGQRDGRPNTSPSNSIDIGNEDNLVLVTKNETWADALQYCREHHVDLVSVTSGQMQRWVVGWAKGASSAHVWMGLRYECSFGFWFWVNGYAVCYSNWAQNAESEFCCEPRGGAVGQDGGKWLSLDENEKLNFICTTKE